MALYCSVIIPTSNRKELLRLVLMSLHVQTNKDFEVVIVDDGSTDGTAELAREWEERLSISYVYMDKVAGTGAARARNAGVELAQGEVILFIDSDSLVKKDFVAEHIRYHQQHPELVVVGIRWHLLPQVIDDAIFDKGISRHVLQLDQLESQNRIFHFFSLNLSQFFMPWWFFSTSNASVRKAALLNAGKFDEGFGSFILYEDTELAFRLYLNSARFVLNHNTECFHLYHKVNHAEKWELSKGSISYFQEKYPHYPEIKSLDRIKERHWDDVKAEERVWIPYLSEVRRAKGIQAVSCERGYLCLVKNGWDGLHACLLALAQNERSRHYKVLVLDLGSTDGTDLHVQLLDVPYPLHYYDCSEMEEAQALEMGKSKLLAPQVEIYRWIQNGG